MERENVLSHRGHFDLSTIGACCVWGLLTSVESCSEDDEEDKGYEEDDEGDIFAGDESDNILWILREVTADQKIKFKLRLSRKL